MLNKILISLLIMTSCVNATENKNIVRDELNGNNSKSMILLNKINNINGININSNMNNGQTNNINNNDNEKQNVINNKIKTDTEKRKELAEIIDKLPDIDNLKEENTIDVNYYFEKLQNDLTILKEKETRLYVEKYHMGKKTCETQVSELQTKLDELKKAKTKNKKNIKIISVTSKESKEEVKSEQTFEIFTYETNELDENLKNDINNLSNKIRNLQEEIRELPSKIAMLNYKISKLKEKIVETENWLTCMEQCKNDGLQKITKKSLEQKSRINSLIHEIADKTVRIYELEEKNQNCLFHKIERLIKCATKKVFERERVRNKIITVISNRKIISKINNKIQKSSNSKLYNKIGNSARNAFDETIKDMINQKKDTITNKHDHPINIKDNNLTDNELEKALIDQLKILDKEEKNITKRVKEHFFTKIFKALTNNSAKMLFNEELQDTLFESIMEYAFGDNNAEIEEKKEDEKIEDTKGENKKEEDKNKDNEKENNNCDMVDKEFII